MTERGDSLQVNRNGNRAEVVLNRPPANALDLPTSYRLNECFAELSRDKDLKVIVLKSASEKIFCAGADVSTVEAHDVPLMDELGRVLKETFHLMRQMPQIIVATVNGHCLGGGLELALAADFRLAGDGPAKWGLPEINLGLFPGGGAVAMMSRLIGPQKTFYLAISGQSISVHEAYDWGLVDQLIEPGSFEERVEQFVAMIERAPGEPVKNIKAAVWQGQEMTLSEAFDFERMMHRVLVTSPDCYEGVEAFKMRRTARFGPVKGPEMP